MINASIRTQILEQLDALSYELQLQVLDFARALAISKPRGVQGKHLLRFAGAIEADDLRAMAQAIESSCERIDLNEW
ncbi:MAG: hypothetical protein ACE5J3_04110 [Methanosarcinales archaeon]